jgi:hypothetical protein
VLLAQTAVVATIDYLERIVANHLRHPMFVGLTANQMLQTA